MNENCWMGDHDWLDGARCVHCGTRLRCFCGRYVRARNLEAHFDRCPWVALRVAMAIGADDAQAS